MNFKRIELIGFKSFADKTLVDFNGGITAIVGPNGCGKSNVADAIRWVLGEQSSKLLRGSSMQDVIFNGTEKRKSLSYCEVSLVLDNTERVLDTDYDEVVLSRKLYRSGESEYLINKNQVRLKDIIDILHDSGIGKNGYSIIGQGKVEEVVSSKPENRRGIFEEAAGIAKFRDKKLEAERKLVRTRDNLSRVNDIIIEIERQLTPLKEQAEVARTYLSLKETLKSLEINNYIYNYDNAAGNKEEIAIRMKALQEEIDVKNQDLEVTIFNHNKNFENINKIDKSIQELYEQVVSLNISLEKSSGETNLLKERLTMLKDEGLRLRQELLKEQKNLSETEKTLQEKLNRKIENERGIEKLNQDSESISEKYLSIVDELTKSEDEAEVNQQLMITALDKLSDIKADISKLNAEKINALEKQAELTNQISDFEVKIRINEEKISSLDVSEKELALTSENLTLKMKETFTNIGEKKKEIENTQSNISSVISTISSLETRHKLLSEMQKGYDGFNGAVKTLMQKAEVNGQLKQNVVGVVASLMKVPKEYETAIEMALGNQVQNIVTENEDNARMLIDYLKDNNYGRATFLPITTLKPRNVDGHEREISSIKGSFGVASRLISYDKKLTNIFENLLGGVVVVDNLVTAVNMARQTRYAFKIVTLDGDVINPQGSITGGSKKYNVSNIVGREREIEDLERQLISLKAKQTEEQSRIELLKSQFEDLNHQLSETSEKKFSTDVEIAKQSETKLKLTAECEECEEKLFSHRQLLAETLAKIKAIDVSMSETDILKDSISTNKSSANESMAKRQEKFETLKRERDQYNAKILDVKVKIAGLKSEITAIDDDVVRLKSEQEETLANLEQISEYISQNEKTIRMAENVIKEKVQDTVYAETHKKLEEVKEKLANLDNYKKQLQDELKVLEEDRVNLTSKVGKLQDKRFQEELNLSRIDSDIENMQERIWEEYQLTYSSAMEFKKENYDVVHGMKETNKIKREIDRLGFVNVNAIEDSKIQQERYDDLTLQNNDLLKAEADLTKIISELAEEMVTRFSTAFEQINTNFSKVFKELFGGGRAELVLTEPESGDLLDAGVDIIAEPPGKKLQNITLLSGGEKALTAIAILFAILKLRPAPFVLLDEIEAALDEANVVRFSQYLKRFSSDTQFIVITHRKPTMEIADSLYGVTMQEKGVSNIVSVKLSDAVETAGKSEAVSA